MTNKTSKKRSRKNHDTNPVKKKKKKKKKKKRKKSRSSGVIISRVHKELQEISKNPPPGVYAAPSADDISEWSAQITGPKGSPYAGGTYFLRIKFPKDYPFKPPNVTFATRIYHCNISTTGEICLDILKDHWSPALTISKVLLSILSLLTDANPKDPLVPAIAHEYKRNRALHDHTARQWTKMYAIRTDEKK
eukprot:g7141.t1